MKFNNVKSLVLSLWIALLFTGFNSNAFFTQYPWYFCDWFPNCNIPNNTNYRLYNATSQLPFTDEYYLSISCILNNNCSNYSSNKAYVNEANSWNYLIKAYNPWEYAYWQYYWTAWYTYNKFNYNFVKVISDWEGYNYYWWNNLTKEYNFKWILRNWYVNSLLPDERFIYFQPRNWSFIFYNQDYLTGFHTIQFIWNYELVDRFLYVDPAEDSDNVYLIDPVSMLAYSKRVDSKEVLTDLLFWNYVLNDNFFNNFGRNKWYDLQFWGTSFFPLTDWNFRCDNLNLEGYIWNGCKTSKFSWIGIVYQQKYSDVIPPNFWSWSSNNTWSYNDQVRTYEQCIADNTPIKDLSHMWYKCLEVVNNNTNITDEDFMELFMYIENLDYYIWQNVEYTWYYPNTSLSNWCGRWVRYAESIYPDYTTWDYHDLAFEAGKYVDTDWYDLEVVCWSHPITSSEQSWTCQYLGIGCDGFSMGMWYDQVKWIVKPFWDETIWQLVNSFNSWYNYFNVPTCSSDLYWKSYGWANVVFIVLVAFLLFEFYQLFKS